MATEKYDKNFEIAIKIVVIASAIVFIYFYGNLILDVLKENFFQKEESFQSIIPVVLNALLIIIGTEIFIVLSRFVISKYFENKGKKKEIKLILTLYTYVVWGITIIFLISTLFKDIGALIASVGLIGFGLTLALQKPIINFIGWLTIVITKPFNSGDRIEVMGIKGDVIFIHTMYTSIQGTRTETQEKSEKVITIPNEVILTNPVINYSRGNEVYSDDITFSITYESNWKKSTELLEKATTDAMKKFMKTPVPASAQEKKSWNEAVSLLKEASKKLRKGQIKEAVKEKIEILQSAENSKEIEIPKPNIQMILADSSINFNVLYQTDLRSLRSTRHEITKNFLEMVEKREDIEIAYPHMQIVQKNTPKFSEKQKKLFRIDE